MDAKPHTMLHSLSAQVSYFSDLIQRRDDWEYMGVYADMDAPYGRISNTTNSHKLSAVARFYTRWWAALKVLSGQRVFTKRIQ